MAIAGAMKVAGKALGKAIKVAKKKKKKLEEKGKKNKIKTKEKIVKDSQKGIDPKGSNIREQIKSVDKIPDMVAGVGSTATGLGASGIAATKKAIDVSKATIKNPKKAMGDAGKSINAKADKVFGDKAGIAGEIAGAAAGALGFVGGYALTASIIKSNSSPEQEYTQSRLADGRFSTSFAGKNSNIVFSEKLLSQKQVDEVRTQVAILESIIESDDPRKRRSEFLNTVILLNNKYGINNITGKNLSIIIPPVKKGQMKKLNIEASGNPAAKNFFG